MADRVYILLGEAIRRRRDAVGMTQAALAGQINLSRTSVTNIERGRQPLLVHQLFKIAAVLGVGVEDLLPTMEAARPQAAREMAAEFQTMLATLRGAMAEVPR